METLLGIQIIFPFDYYANERGYQILGWIGHSFRFWQSTLEREFHEDNNRWKDWVKWMILVEDKELPHEKTALKILGLPLRLFDEENFSKIVVMFGRVISPFNKTRRD